MRHPADGIIGIALQSTEYLPFFEWLKTCSVDIANPRLAALVLCCQGRLNRPGTTSWRVDLVRSTMGVEDAVIRDTAVQTAVSWCSENIRKILVALE